VIGTMTWRRWLGVLLALGVLVFAALLDIWTRTETVGLLQYKAQVTRAMKDERHLRDELEVQRATARDLGSISRRARELGLTVPQWNQVKPHGPVVESPGSAEGQQP